MSGCKLSGNNQSQKKKKKKTYCTGIDLIFEIEIEIKIDIEIEGLVVSDVGIHAGFEEGCQLQLGVDNGLDIHLR